MALKETIQEERQMKELLNETQELNRLMISYIRVQMNEETAKDMTIESQLEKIREHFNQMLYKMESTSSRQKEFTEQSEKNLQQVLIDGQQKLERVSKETVEKLLELKEENNMQLQSINEEMKNSKGKMEDDMREIVQQAREEAKGLRGRMFKGALGSSWLSAFKYGIATSVIAVPSLLLLDWLLL